jgi:L-iditol 2-dehydrogenase/L-idonate 5-dehydrogenase
MSQPNLALLAHAREDLRVQDVPEPEPAADEAVIAIAFGGICGSDLHYWLHGAAGQSILREPMVLGHEIVGTVLQQAADGSGPTAGTRVAVHPATVIDDGITPWPRERQNLSPAGTYLGSAARFPHTQGAFARRVALPSRMLHPLPENLSLRTAAAVEPASVAWHGVGQAGDVTGKKVLVIGAGPIGLFAVAVLCHHGAGSVVVSDLFERPREIAHELGAEATLDARDSEALARVGADVVIEASGTVPGLSNAIAAAVRGGTVVMLGLQKAGVIEAPVASAITRELTLVGSFRFDTEIDPVIAALADGTLQVDPALTDEFPIEEGLAAMERARDSANSSKVLLRF